MQEILPILYIEYQVLIMDAGLSIVGMVHQFLVTLFACKKLSYSILYKLSDIFPLLRDL